MCILACFDNNLIYWTIYCYKITKSFFKNTLFLILNSKFVTIWKWFCSEWFWPSIKYLCYVYSLCYFNCKKNRPISEKNNFILSQYKTNKLFFGLKITTGKLGCFSGNLISEIFLFLKTFYKNIYLLIANFDIVHI